MSRMKLEDYDVSLKTAFVLEDPLTSLPEYFEPWNRISQDVVNLIDSDTLRDEVLKMPVLDFNRLEGEREVKLAHSQLGIITNCYLWYKGKEPDQVPKVLPKCLAVPLWGIFKKYDIMPILNYSDLFINNCVRKDKSRPYGLDNIAPFLKFPGGDIFHWFYVFGMQVEFRFAAAAPALQDILDGVDEEDEEKITRSLEQITEAVSDLKNSNHVLKENMPTEAFVKELSQFFTGYEDPPLVDGLIFEGVSEVPYKAKGSDAGQGCIIKILDALLNIEHEKGRDDHTKYKIQFVQPKHRQFLKDVQNRPVRLRDFVKASSNQEMKVAFDNLVEAIIQFRCYHMRLVAKYFILGLNKTNDPEQLEMLKPLKNHTMSYLKGMRDDTKQGKIST